MCRSCAAQLESYRRSRFFSIVQARVISDLDGLILNHIVVKYNTFPTNVIQASSCALSFSGHHWLLEIVSLRELKIKNLPKCGSVGRVSSKVYQSISQAHTQIFDPTRLSAKFQRFFIPGKKPIIIKKAGVKLTFYTGEQMRKHLLVFLDVIVSSNSLSISFLSSSLRRIFLHFLANLLCGTGEEWIRI